MKIEISCSVFTQQLSFTMRFFLLRDSESIFLVVHVLFFSLLDCLQKFVDIEELAETEHWICGNCKTKQRSTKKFSIRRLPKVLCLHIKRFRWSPYSRTKIDTHVAFPLSGLDMSNYLLSNLHETRCSIAGSSLYDLAAVIVHHGSG